MNIKQLKIIILVALFVMSALVITPLGFTQSASGQPSGISTQSPITIYNNQSVATPNPYQQMLQLTESIYTGYLYFTYSSANFEFSYANNTIIPAWVESNDSGVLTIWLSLVSIPANSQLTIYIDFASLATNLLSNSGTIGVGEAPQLSSTYAEYDDGASVFSFYDNFAGTTLNSEWSTANALGLSYNVNNGFSATASTATDANIVTSISYSSPLILDFYGNLYQSDTNWTESGFVTNSSSNNQGTFLQGSSGSVYGQLNNGTAINTDNLTTSNNGNQTWSVIWANPTTTFQLNYGNSQSASESGISSSLYIGLIKAKGGAFSQPYYIQWIRARAYPPNGVMPSVSYVATSQYTVTFNESGLPSGTEWDITIITSFYSTNTTSISVTLINGTYSYEAQSNAGYSPIYGNVTVNGANQSVSLTFINNLFNIDFTESGLPSGTEWNVTINATTYFTNTTSIIVYLPNGIYSYEAQSSNILYSPVYGNATVNNENQGISFFFINNLFSIDFTESGLPSGTEWNVTLNNSVYSTNTTSISVVLSNGTYSYEAQSSNTLYSLLYGNVTVNGVSQNVSLTFSTDIINQSLITIDNNQSIATPNPYQQMLQFNESIYNGYITYNGTIANFEFSYVNNTIIPSWIESNDSGVLTIWLNLISIAANSNLTIYINFASLTTNLLSSSGTTGIGEAPQLSPTYAEYDDGASVFSFYDNFAGTSLNTSMWTVVNNGGNVTVNNGITINNNAAYSEGIVSNIGINPNSIFEIYRESQVAGEYSTYGLALFNTSTIQQTSFSGYEYNGWSGGYFSSTYTDWNGTAAINSSTPFPSSTPVIVGIVWLATGNEYTEIGSNGVFTHYTNSSLTISSLLYPGIGNSGLSTDTSQTDYWARTRALPPNSVMPSVSYGAIQPINFTVTFEESGLPSNTLWNVTLNNSVYSTNTTSLNVSLANGTYSFEAQSSNTSYLPINANFEVNGANIVINLSFVQPSYSVIFNESGLPSNTTWNVTINNHTYSTFNSTSIDTVLINGTYSYEAQSSNTAYLPIYGNVTVDGFSITVNLTFVEYTYTVTFEELGLPSNTLWNVTINNNTYSTNTTSLNVSLANGTYTYIASSSNTTFASILGNLGVLGNNVTVILNFVTQTYTVTFEESGLPSGTLWNVTTNNTLYSTNTTSLSVSLVNGTYSYEALSSNTSYLPINGNFTIIGVDITINLDFVEPEYIVTFEESSLPSNTMWNVTINNNTYSTNTTSLNTSLVNGTYSYEAQSFNYLTINGITTINGAEVTITLIFILSTYTVTFNEVGLPLNTLWNVTINNNTYSTNSTSLNISLANGTYTYEAQSFNSFYLAINGVVTINGVNININLNFSLSTDNLEFNITGLPSGDILYINVINTNNGTIMFSIGATSQYIYASLPNASYDYIMNVSDNNYSAFGNPYSALSFYKIYQFPTIFNITNNLTIINISVVYDVLTIQESGLNMNTSYGFDLFNTSNMALISTVNLNSQNETEYIWQNLPIDINITVTTFAYGTQNNTEDTFYFTGNYIYDFNFIDIIATSGNITINVYEIGLPLDTLWYFNLFYITGNITLYNESSYYSFITFFNITDGLFSYTAYSQGYNIIYNPQYNLVNNTTITINFILGTISIGNTTTFTNPYNSINNFNYTISQWKTIGFLGGSTIIMAVVGAFINPIGAFIVLGIEMLIGYELSIIDGWILFFVGLAITALIFYSRDIRDKGEE